MSIRTKFVAVLVAILTLGVGTTGTVLILRHARHDRELLADKQRLVVESGAFSLKENLSVAARELVRLSRLRDIDLEDNDPMPEREALRSAHEDSVFFREVRLIDADGRVTLVQPAGAVPSGQSYAERRWFQEARAAHQPFFHTTPEKAEWPEGVAVIVPVRHGGRFAGAIQGLIDVRDDKVLAPELRHAAGPAGQYVVFDRDGRLVLGGGALPVGHGLLDAAAWSAAAREATEGRSGTARVVHGGEEHLVAWAPVGIAGWGVAMRWPWRTLHGDTRVQVQTTVLVLVFGVVVAALLGLGFAAYLTRPLEQLGEVARRVGRGEPGRAGPSRRGDEIGALFNAFDHMEGELAARDRKIRDDLETISRLNASLEQRVRERTADLERAQARLLDAERFAAMGKTAAAVSHEVRNALNGLGMCVDLVLADTPRGASSLKVRAQIHHEIARLRDITDSLLTFARTPRLDLAPADVNDLVVRALEVLSEQVGDAGVAVETRLAADGAPLVARCDAHKVQGVIINLVKNAIESLATRPLDLAGDGAPTPGGERRVEIVTRSVDAGGAVELAVSDTGPGIGDEARGRLFEPFFTTKVTGTGLGLATARRILDAHGGTIAAERAPSGGARFVVRLPVEPRAAA